MCHVTSKIVIKAINSLWRTPLVTNAAYQSSKAYLDILYLFSLFI